jgi:glycerophosphoryl diester phosphodiesterase
MLRLFLLLVDMIFSWVPRQLKKSKDNILIVAHRGATDSNAPENTIEAFKNCLDKNIWAIEFDVLWTEDNVPVIHHDNHCERIFNRKDIVIKNTLFSLLNHEISKIPKFEDVVKLFSNRLHLMIELKEKPTKEQETILKKILKDLSPTKDFHLLCLDPHILEDLSEFPKNCFVLVSEYNLPKHQELCKTQRWGGYATHYILINNKEIQELHSKNVKIGIGYAASKNSLYREANRNIDWIFTNHPLKLSSLISN